MVLESSWEHDHVPPCCLEKIHSKFGSIGDYILGVNKQLSWILSFGPELLWHSAYIVSGHWTLPEEEILWCIFQVHAASGGIE